MDDLSRTQGFALIAEMDSARNLLAYGTRVIRTAQFIETTRDPILTMLSIGVEKLLKMALGLTILNETGSWPSRTVMQNEFRHGSQRMDGALRAKLRLGIGGRDGTPYITGILQAVEDDPIWPAMLATLDMYGRSGRFYNLDLLGEARQSTESPTAFWNDLEQAVLASDPELRAQMNAAMNGGSNDDWEAFYSAVNNAIADSVYRWWEMIAILGRHGVLGETGTTFGWEVHPTAVGRQ